MASRKRGNKTVAKVLPWPKGWVESYLQEIRDGGEQYYMQVRLQAAKDLEITVWELDELVGLDLYMPKKAVGFLMLIDNIFRELGCDRMTTLEIVNELIRLKFPEDPIANPVGVVTSLGIFGIEAHRAGAGSPHIFYHEDLVKTLSQAGDVYTDIYKK